MRGMLYLLLAIGVTMGMGNAASKKINLWKPAKIDQATGQMIALWVKKSTPKKILVRKKYAILIVWNGQEKRFYLFHGPKKQYFNTSNFPQFLKELNKLPPNTKLDWIDTCTVPRNWKMPKRAIKTLQVTLKREKKTLTYHRICYCESRGLKYLPR